MKIAIRQENGKIRNIGTFNDGLFICFRKYSKHFHRNLNSWGIDAAVFDDLVDKGLEKVVIRDTERGIDYEADVQTIKLHGKEMNFKPHRTQIFLPLALWKTKGG